MFLILGTSECKYCLECRKLLDSLELKYTYVDLGLKLEDWKSIFSTLKSILGTQRTIPIIFKYNANPGPCVDPGHATVPEELTVESLNETGWELVGTFFDLEELVEDMEDMEFSITDNY